MSGSMDSRDKRAAARVCHDSVVEIFGENGKLLFSGRLSDCSDTGAAFLSSAVLKAGDKLRMRMRMLEKGVLDATAVVVRAKKEGALNFYGVRFEQIKRVHPTGELKEPGAGLGF